MIKKVLSLLILSCTATFTMERHPVPKELQFLQNGSEGVSFAGFYRNRSNSKELSGDLAVNALRHPTGLYLVIQHVKPETSCDQRSPVAAFAIYDSTGTPTTQRTICKSEETRTYLEEELAKAATTYVTRSTKKTTSTTDATSVAE